jgi:hypothetical protein
MNAGCYLHLRPDGSLFYVGKGGAERARTFRKRNPHHKNIVAKHGPENIIVSLIPCASEEEAFSTEVQLINSFRQLGYNLCNMTDGGEGCSGYIKSEETREKLSKAMKGKPNPGLAERHRAGKWKRGRTVSPDSIAKRNATRAANGKPNPLRGKPRPGLAERNRAGKWNTGKTLSQATKDKIRAAKLGKPLSAAHIAAVSAGMLGNIPWNKGINTGEPSPLRGRPSGKNGVPQSSEGKRSLD